MLLEYGFKNFLSFKEGATVSFKLDANCPQSISHGLDFTPVLCVKGANGSGKTHLLKALAFVADFASKSFAKKPEDAIHVATFFGSKDPSEFYVEFCLGDTKYRYELSVTTTEVKRETLYKTVKKRTTLFERVDAEVVSASKALDKLKTTIKVRKNASIISTARQYELKELAGVYKFFENILANVSYGGIREGSTDIGVISKFLHSKHEVFNFVKQFISECDIGISDIKILGQDGADGEKKYFPVFFHKVGERQMPISAVTESSGTKQLFRILAHYKLMIDTGGVLIMDEFDIYLHAHILPKILDLFLDGEKNEKRAQLLFTTHNSDILNDLGRYRTYLVNKEANESFAYRLDEIPGDVLRNDRAILPVYNDGKIGGIPKL